MRNDFERRIYGELVKTFGKKNVNYETIKLPYIETKIYTPDFIIDTEDGQILVETKGFFRKENMRTMKAVKEMHPDLDLRMIFQQDKKYSKRMRYSDWADKYGFKYGVDKVPKDWKP
jgi:predicted nuclease of restriction endonuclease-like RecB superfamily